VEKKLAEEQERERQRIEEQKKLQEKRKEQAEALAERKLQEQKVYERQRKVGFLAPCKTITIALVPTVSLVLQEFLFNERRIFLMLSLYPACSTAA